MLYLGYYRLRKGFVGGVAELSGRLFQPLVQARLDNAGQEGHQIGAQSGVEGGGLARAEGQQAGRCRGAGVQAGEGGGTSSLRSMYCEITAMKARRA